MKKITFYLALIVLVASSCESCEEPMTENETGQALGWLADDEHTDNIEDAVNFGSTFGSGNLPASVDLRKNFPPIGDQGQYGTCVAWAVGYNHRSYLQAKRNGYTNYSDASKIFSPKDLFWAIDNSKKGEDCNGTNFQAAYDILLSRGIATLSTVPYQNLGTCSQRPDGSWTSEAAGNKIENYREIAKDKNTIKDYLAAGRAVVFGAKLGDEFMNYSSGIFDYQSYGYTGQHAYHAMILAGYDDNKGSNGAFLIVNSWGTNWGDNGIMRIDQDFFCSDDFCFCAFVASDGASNPDQDGDNEVDNTTSGYDIMAWELQDTDYDVEDDPDSNDPLWRTSYYNVYNAGEEMLAAEKDWSIAYILYNAYDGNDYQILLFDYYSDDYGNAGQNGELTDANITDQIPAQGHWWNHVDVASGESVSNAVFGNDKPFKWHYKMPNITGDYYLVIFADAFDTFQEADEDNNFSYYTADNGEPLHISNGIIQNAPAKKSFTYDKRALPFKGQKAENQTVRQGNHLNAYTTNEIKQKLIYDRKTGALQQKVYEYMRNSSKGKTQYSK